MVPYGELTATLKISQRCKNHVDSESKCIVCSKREQPVCPAIGFESSSGRSSGSRRKS